MFPALAAALSMTASLAIEVPYLSQTDGLCGGAAAAMVFRYWGDAHADIRQFAPLVDRRAGGIGDRDLVEAINGRGWRTARFDGTIELVEQHLGNGRPVIVLLEDTRTRYHYVVVVGATDDAIVVHDPSWGPSRRLRRDEFVRLWRTSRFWSLVIQPGDTPGARSVSPVPAARSDCPTLDSAIADVQRQGLGAADAIFARVQAECPDSAGPPRELAGVRFAQRRWRDAAALARDAIDKDPRDAYALDVLGSSLFMQDDAAGALRVWNQIDKPRVDLVRIEGIRRSRHQAIAGVLGIQPNALLTADLFEQAARRLHELPDRSSSRLSVRPGPDGFASVDVAIAERAALPRGTVAWIATSARAAADRQADVTVPGFTGQGDVWSASWRWWANRPRVAMTYAAPRLGGIRGVWQLDAGWERETYAGAVVASDALVRESRAHGGLTISDWLSGSTRVSVSAGVDSWSAGSGARTAASIGGSIERRWLGDRVSASAEASRWIPATRHPGFHTAAARVAWRSSLSTVRWMSRLDAGLQRASDAAPRSVWPGAGDGHGRAPLLRAHPLLDDGIIDLRTSVFERTLTHASVEGQRWFQRPSLVRLGIAGFADAARTRGRPAHIDVGAGLRIKIPGTDGIVRVDAARGLRDGANALTFGWLF